MSDPPNSEFAKIFELLNAFEQLDEQQQSAVLETADPSNLSLRLTAAADRVIASEPDVDNTLAAHIAAAMAKRMQSEDDGLFGAEPRHIVFVVNASARGSVVEYGKQRDRIEGRGRLRCNHSSRIQNDRRRP